MEEKPQKKEDKEDIREKNIVWLSELSKKDIPIAGGKGANLAEMYNAGMPVPPAFIITSKAFNEFITDSNLKERILEILGTIQYEDTKDLEEKAKQIRGMILSTDFPKDLSEEIIESYSFLNEDENQEPCFVAVRSSATTEDLATASFAGQQETFLNIKGNKDLLDYIRKCWASLYTARAIYYRNKNNFPHETSLIAVVVQKMVNSETSGVMFTINPANNNKNELVIEGVFGLGEGIVSGTIEPDTYIFDKESGEMTSKRLGKKKVTFIKDENGKTIQEPVPTEKQEEQVFNESELNELFKHGRNIEEHYDWPQDIEFALEKGKVYIVQSRPVTTLEKEMKEVKIKNDYVLLKGLAASRGVASGPVKVIYSLGELDKIQEGDILVTKMTNPDMVVTMQKSKAIITDEGGMTAHAAIVSREIGIPCVVGTKEATKMFHDGQIVTVDGTNGIIYSGEIVLEEAEKSPESEEIISGIYSPKEQSIQEKTENKEEFKLTDKNKKILVKVNCDLPYVAKKAAITGADGVGLVRIEFIIAQSGVHPAEYIREKRMSDYTIVLANGLKEIAEAFKDKPIWIRTSDIRTDEYRSLKGAEQEPRESNPMLGWHGIRRGLDQEEMLKSEFRAIKQLHDLGYSNVGVMIPFLINVDEFIRAKEMAKEVGLDVDKMDFGVMIETPASCWIIEDLCKQGIKFISFGTNDLTQLTLGIDRNSERLASLYSEMHPSMKGQMKMVIDICNKYNVQTSICGQAGSNPEMVKFLLNSGISSVSVNLDSVSLIKNIVNKFQEERDKYEFETQGNLKEFPVQKE